MRRQPPAPILPRNLQSLEPLLSNATRESESPEVMHLIQENQRLTQENLRLQEQVVLSAESHASAINASIVDHRAQEEQLEARNKELADLVEALMSQLATKNEAIKLLLAMHRESPNAVSSPVKIPNSTATTPLQPHDLEQAHFVDSLQPSSFFSFLVEQGLDQKQYCAQKIYTQIFSAKLAHDPLIARLLIEANFRHRKTGIPYSEVNEKNLIDFYRTVCSLQWEDVERKVKAVSQIEPNNYSDTLRIAAWVLYVVAKEHKQGPMSSDQLDTIIANITHCDYTKGSYLSQPVLEAMKALKQARKNSLGNCVRRVLKTRRIDYDPKVFENFLLLPLFEEIIQNEHYISNLLIQFLDSFRDEKREHRFILAANDFIVHGEPNVQNPLWYYALILLYLIVQASEGLSLDRNQICVIFNKIHDRNFKVCFDTHTGAIQAELLTSAKAQLNEVHSAHSDDFVGLLSEYLALAAVKPGQGAQGVTPTKKGGLSARFLWGSPGNKKDVQRGLFPSP